MKIVQCGFSNLAIAALLLSQMRDIEIVEVNVIELRPMPDLKLGYALKENQQRTYGPQKRRKGKVVKW